MFDLTHFQHIVLKVCHNNYRCVREVVVVQKLEFIVFWAMSITKPFSCLGFGYVHSHRPYELVGRRATMLSRTHTGMTTSHPPLALSKPRPTFRATLEVPNVFPTVFVVKINIKNTLPPGRGPKPAQNHRSRYENDSPDPPPGPP